ncbi:MAG: response regulator, partial [Wolinella sp.]
MAIRVLVIDDSASARAIIKEMLALDSEIEVVGSAPDAYVARDKILELHPDVLCLDVEMPRMDGITFLKKLMIYHPMPVVMVSSLTREGAKTTLEALASGAVDFVAKNHTHL